MNKAFTVLLIGFFAICTKCSNSQSDTSQIISVDSTLKVIKELDYRASVEGDTTLLDSAYSLLKQRKIVEHLEYFKQDYSIVLPILAKKGDWERIVDLLETYRNKLNDTLYVFLNYSKYRYYLGTGNETEAKKYIQKNLDILYNKIVTEKETTFWIYEIAQHVYLLHGYDFARKYLKAIDSNHFEFISSNQDKAIEILLQNIKDQNKQ